MPSRSIVPGLLIAVSLAACSKEPAPTLPPWAPALLSPGGTAAATVESIKTQLPALMTRAEVPGLALAVIVDGDVVWSGGFGVANSKTRDAVTASTVFEGAALGKPVLAAVALRLVELGKLDLDRPIASDFRDRELGGDPRYAQITLRQLLSHTSGLANLTRDRPAQTWFRPGDHFSYSGIGYMLAQRLVEHVTGEPLDAVAARLVFQPAGMSSTSYTWQSSFDGRGASGHRDDGLPAEKRRPATAFAPGSLHTTADDYGRFIVALLQGKLIGPAMLKEMLTPQIAVTPECVQCLELESGSRSTQVFWGLGWGLNRTPGGLVMWLWGDNDVFRAYVVVAPDRKIGLVYLTNSQNGLALRDELVNHVLGGDHPDWTFVKYDQYDAAPVVAARAIGSAFRESAAAGNAEYTRQKAAGTVPVTGDYLDRLGIKLLTQRHPEAAVAAWELATREFPQSAHAFNSLGLGYMALGDRTRSLEAYRKALEISPGDVTARRALAAAGGR